MTEPVVVPDLVGQPVHVAREVAARTGLGLASGNPDGPGIGSLTWPGYYRVTGQEPSAGSSVERGSQIRVDFIEDGQARSGVPVRTSG